MEFIVSKEVFQRMDSICFGILVGVEWLLKGGYTF